MDARSRIPRPIAHGMELTCPAGRFTRRVRTARSVVMARVRVRSHWSNETHRLVDARPVKSASCMLHAASIPRGTFLFTFSACIERAIPFYHMIWLIGAHPGAFTGL